MGDHKFNLGRIGDITVNKLNDQFSKATRFFNILYGKITTLEGDEASWINIIGGIGYLNSWVDFDTTNAVGAYYKDRSGRVHVKGLIKSGTINNNAFILPVGYRPPKKLLFSTASNDAYGQIAVFANGEFLPEVGNNTWFSINCSFRAG